MKTIGILLIFLGIACADSPSLIVPAVLLGLGAVLHRAGEKKTVRSVGGAGTVKK